MYIKTYMCILFIITFIIINVHYSCILYNAFIFITFQIMGIQFDDNNMILTYYYQYYISIDNIISMATKKISLGTT